MDPSSFHSRICSMVLQNHETNIDGLGCDLMFQCSRTWNDSRWWIILSPVSGVGPKTWDKKHMTAGKLRFKIRWFMMFPMKLDWQVPQSIVHTEVVCSFEVGRSHSILKSVLPSVRCNPNSDVSEPVTWTLKKTIYSILICLDDPPLQIT